MKAQAGCGLTQSPGPWSRSWEASRAPEVALEVARGPSAPCWEAGEPLPGAAVFAQLCPPIQEEGGSREPPFSRKRPAAATACSRGAREAGRGGAAGGDPAGGLLFAH